MDLFLLLADETLPMISLHDTIPTSIIFQLMVRPFPVLTSCPNLLIQLHNMRHLILQSNELLLEVFDLQFQVIHGLLSVSDHGLQVLDLEL